MTSCEECTRIVEATLTALLITQKIDSCITLALEFEAECILVGGGPEDPIADAVCTIAAALITDICIEYGITHMRHNIPKIAKIICKKLDFC